MRGAKRHYPTIGLISLALLAGCSWGDPAAEQLGGASQPIIGGSLDTTHQAVITIESPGGSCSGTIFHVTGGYAYILTAAHCFGSGTPTQLKIGDDNDSPDATLNTIDYEVHPYYDDVNLTYDYALIQASGVQAGTPFIPVMTPDDDDLAQGTMINLVGFGLTSWPDGNTSRRHHIELPIEGVSVQDIWYLQDSGGVCSGDSGGAGLTQTPKGERVAGVTSASGEECKQAGISARVSLVYDHFIAPYAGLPPSSSSGSGGGGGSGGGAAGGGGAGTDGDSWHAGDVADDDITGDVVSSCALRDGDSSDDARFAFGLVLLLLAAGSYRSRARRRR